MKDKMTRYGIRLFTLDRNSNIYMWCWKKNDINKFLEDEYKHYGFKTINEKSQIIIKYEYSNIIWEYKLYLGSFKKRFQHLTKDDSRWIILEEYLLKDLKVMGLEFLIEQIIVELKNKLYFEYANKVNIQFKNYCIEK